MHDALAVQVVQPLEDPQEDLQRGDQRDPRAELPADHLLERLPAADEIEHQRDAPLVLDQLPGGEHVGVLEAGADQALFVEARSPPLVRVQLGVQHLQGHGGPVHAVACRVDLPHPAASDQTPDGVGAKLSAIGEPLTVHG